MRETIVRMNGDQHGALLAALADVPADGWRTPSPCPGWSVADVMAHLVEGSIAVGRVLRGEVTDTRFVDLTELDDWRALPPEAVRAALWQHGGANQRVLEAMDDQRWSTPIRAFGCRRVSQLARLTLFEAIVHGFDMTEPLGAPRPWSDGRLAFAVSFAVRAAGAAIARHGGADPGWIRFSTDLGIWTLRGDGHTWSRTDDDDAPTRVEIRAEHLLLAVTGRTSVDEALDAAGVTGSDPDRDLIRQVLGAWQVSR